jgi:hypothetical protein
MHPCWRACDKNLNIVSMCAVSPVVHTSNISNCQKKNFFSFPVAVNNSFKVTSFGFLVTNVYNHDDYETPCIYILLYHPIFPRLATGWTVRGSNPIGGEIFRTRPDRPWGQPSLLYNGYRVFPGGKTAGAWCWPPTPFKAPRPSMGIAIPLLPLWALSGLLFVWPLPYPIFQGTIPSAEYEHATPLYRSFKDRTNTAFDTRKLYGATLENPKQYLVNSCNLTDLYSGTSVHERPCSRTIRFTNKFSEQKNVSDYEHASWQQRQAEGISAGVSCWLTLWHTQPPVRRSEPPMSLLLVLAFCQ